MGDHKVNPFAPFARGTSVPPPPSSHVEAQDMYGRALHLADEVVLPTIQCPRYRVVQVAPEMDPGAPPHTVRVVLATQVILHVRQGVPVTELLRVRTAAEAGVSAPLPSAEGDTAGAPEKETRRVIE